METFFLPLPDEDTSAFRLRLALKEAFPDIDLNLIQALNAHLLTGCTYRPEIQKKIEKMKSALANKNLKKIDISETEKDVEYITSYAAAIINPEELVSGEENRPENEDNEENEDQDNEDEENEDEENEDEEESQEESEQKKETKNKGRKLAQKKSPMVETKVARQITVVSGNKINYHEVEDIQALRAEIAKADRMANFKLHLIDYIFGERLRALKGLEAELVRQEAQKWFAGYFYLNLAKENIPEFVVQAFENNKVAPEKVDEFWKASTEPPKTGNYVLRPIGEDLSLEFGNKKLLLSNSFYNLSQAKYVGEAESLNTAIFILGLRYSVLELDIESYSAVPGIVRQKFNFELFSSPFNSDLKYFSPFPEIEEDFGSSGQFFENIPEDDSTRIIFFPPDFDSNEINYAEPYGEKFINRAINLLLENYFETERTILCVLPVWNPIQRQSLHLNLRTEDSKPTKDVDKAKRFSGYDKLKNSKYFVEEAVETDLQFFNFATANKVKRGPVCLILLALGKPRFKMPGLLEIWRQFNSKS